MTELDITLFVRVEEPAEFSASRVELGNDAAKITWGNAVEHAKNTRLDNAAPWITAENRDVFDAWVREFGAWDAKEIAAWSLDECNALLIQYISGDLRELESLCFSETDEFGIDWGKAQKLSEEGAISGNIYKGDDGKVYFYMGS